MHTIEGKEMAAHRTDGRTNFANVYFDQKSVPKNRCTLSKYDVVEIRANRIVNAGEDLCMDYGGSYVFKWKRVYVDTGFQ